MATRLRHLIVVAFLLTAPLVAACTAHATTGDDVEPAAVRGGECAPEGSGQPVHVRFWVGPFEFSIALGGLAGVALSFEGLR